MTVQINTTGAMLLVQRGTLEKIAAMKNGGGDEPNGSGYDMCPVCFGEGKWRWKSGSVVGVDPIAHDADCSLEAIRALLSTPAAHPPAFGVEVDRWALCENETHIATDGEWVAYADHHAHIATLLAEIERLKGLQPDMPPRPPEGSGLPRYGLRWNGPQQPLAVPMDDGYWTPWHLAVQVGGSDG